MVESAEEEHKLPEFTILSQEELSLYYHVLRQDLLVLKRDVCELKPVVKDVTAIKDSLGEVLEWVKEARQGFKFVFKISNGFSAFVVWIAKVVGALAVAGAGIVWLLKALKIPIRIE